MNDTLLRRQRRAGTSAQTRATTVTNRCCNPRSVAALYERRSHLAERTCFALLALGLWTTTSLAAPANASASNVLHHARVVLFLGDSITYSGQYIDYFETGLILRYPTQTWRINNAGLPSETVSGLSEQGHAGGAFPRPDLHERLDRVLRRIHPSLVLACYGMNDGIYHPREAGRTARFTEGVRWLRQKAIDAGAEIVFLTPPVFDPLPIKERTLPAGQSEYRQPYEGYNQVLDYYSEWLVEQRAQGWLVADLHDPMNRLLAAQRKSDPVFTLARDGVHPNAAGHWLMAHELLDFFGVSPSQPAWTTPEAMLASHPRGKEVFGLVQQRQRVTKDAWLNETGHQRPGMARGKLLAEALSEAEAIEKRIREALSQTLSPVIRHDGQGRYSITVPDTNAVIRYTLDGSEPGVEAGAYLAPISLPQGGTIKARAFGANHEPRGDVATMTCQPLDARAAALPSTAVPVTQNRDWRIYDWAKRHEEVKRLVKSSQPEILFIGDSITHFFEGEPRAPIARGSAAWSRLCAGRNAVNLGFGWDRTENVLWRLRHGEVDGADPKAVVILIGTNNLDVNSPDEIAEGIRAVCAEIRQRLPRARILLLGLLPRSQKPDDRRSKLAQVNERMARLDDGTMVNYLDAGSKFLNADGSIPRELMDDYLHPTARGYEVLVDAIQPELERLMTTPPPQAGAAFPGTRRQWNRFDRYDFTCAGQPTTVIVPPQPVPGKLWAWKGEFLDAFPGTEIALLRRGVHIVYVSLPDMLGSPEAVKAWTACYEELVTRHGLAPRPALIGLSRGGLYCYNWAAANPEKVACIYGDAPVCDLKSWPGGKGKGKGSPRDWDLAMKRYGFKSEVEALAAKVNPVDNLEPLARTGIPLLHVYGDADDVVPWDENTGLLAERYKKLGGSITLISKPGIGHHPHGLADPGPVVDFIITNTTKRNTP
jgi:lysophospholipase L1-like esterase/pimeloyl-ACP methyl ester carboxylesterase